MTVTAITDQILQYGKATEVVYNIIAVLTGLFVIFVVISQLIYWKRRWPIGPGAA